MFDGIGEFFGNVLEGARDLLIAREETKQAEEARQGVIEAARVANTRTIARDQLIRIGIFGIVGLAALWMITRAEG